MKAYLVTAEVEIVIVAENEAAARSEMDCALKGEIRDSGWTDLVLEVARRRPIGWKEDDLVYSTGDRDILLSEAMALNEEAIHEAAEKGQKDTRHE